MFVALVLDPSALKERYFSSHDGYNLQAQSLFRGIQENGLLLVDSHDRLLDQTKKYIADLHPKFSQSLQILFEEVLKGKHIIKCDSDGSSSSDTLALCSFLQHQLNPDAVISSPDNFHDLESRATHNADRVVSLSDYLDSNFELCRRNFSNPSPAFSLLSKDECRELFSRVTRFTKHLHLWDKQLVRCNNPDGAANFHRGISFILEAWKETGHFRKKNVEIWTFENKRHRKNAVTKGRRLFKSEIIDKFKATYTAQDGWDINFHINEDPHDSWHARYLETDAGVVLLERGFDFISHEDGSLKTTYLVRIDEPQEELESYKRRASTSSS